MTHKPTPKDILPRLLTQNPSPVGVESQDRIDKKREQVDSVMQVFYRLLPSNYVSTVTGPFYTIQMQAAAERIAEFQITAQEVFADRAYDYTRSEFLFQLLGTLIFPDANSDGYPDLKGDLTYRDFLREMVKLLLAGATKETQEGGLALLSDADFTLIEKVIAARSVTRQVWNESLGVWETQPGSAWGLDDQFAFEVNVSYLDPITGGQRFPEDPFTLQENVRIVLRALKPAHSIYEYRHLFQETFGAFFTESMSWDLDHYRYEDFRRWCCGVKWVVSDAGQTLADKRLFSDVTRDFGQIRSGAELVVLSGPNSIHVGGTEGTSASTDRRQVGRYKVAEVLYFPVGDDSTARSYVTSPSGLTGVATVSGRDIEDSSQDWSLAVEGEVLTFSDGPNAGSYRLASLLGTDGGPIGVAVGPATRVRVAPCLLRLDRRMKTAATGQSYTLGVDRLGEQVPRTVAGEDVTVFFLR